MKFNNSKVKVVSRGINPSIDFTLSDSYCPHCGAICRKAQFEKFTKEGIFYIRHGRRATYECSSCGTIFRREICDSKKLTNDSATIFYYSAIILALSALSFIFFCFFNITIGYVISLIILIISLIVFGVAAFSD